MAVYNPPDQVLASPIRSYYRGKALRADTALREKQAEALQMEIDSAPAAAEAAYRKEQRAEEKLRIAREKEDRLAAAEEAERIVQGAYADTLTYDSLLNSDGPEKAAAWIGEKWRGLYDQMEGGPEKQQFGQMLKDGITPEEVTEAKNTFGTILGQFEKGPSDYTLGSDYRFSGETNEIIARAPDAGRGGEEGSRFAKPSIKDFTSASIAKFNKTGNEADLVPRPKDEKPTTREAKIRDLRALNTPEDKIIDLVDGYLSVTSSTDSQGNVTVTNTRTGDSSKVSARQARAAGLDIPDEGVAMIKTKEYSGPRWAQPIAKIQPSSNLDNTIIVEAQRSMQEIDKGLQAAALISAEDTMDAAGIANITQRGINNALQMISFNMLPRIFQEETDARLKVLNFNQAVRSAVVISSKGNIWEQKKVEEMLPNPDNITSDPVGEAIAFSRTIHWLMNTREVDVSVLEGRKPQQIPRKELGVKDDPIVVISEEEANEYPPGTWIILNGRLAEVVQ